MAKYTNQNYKELANIIATESENIQDYVEGKKLNKRLKDITYYRLISLQHVALKCKTYLKKITRILTVKSFLMIVMLVVK